MGTRIVELDGSLGEGGGQILRSSLALALLTGTPFRLRNIRAARHKPGLQPQHLTSVRAAAQIGQARVQGDRQGSRELFFEPGEVVAGTYQFQIGTAGSTSLVIQTIALPLALRGRAPSQVIVSGGTHVRASPCYDFIATTWRGYLERMGLTLTLTMHQPGFYPRGGGVVEARVEPAAGVRPLRLDPAAARPAELHVTGLSCVAGLPEHIAERQAAQAIARLREARLRCELRRETWPDGPGTVLALVLHGPPAPTVFFALGQRGRPAERIADDAVEELLAHLRRDPLAVDAHSADQILLPLALADGPSEYPVSCVTQHLLTNIQVIRRFIDRDVTCIGAEGGPGRVVIR